MPVTHATVADMQARFRPEQLVQLSDWDGSGSLDSARIEAAIAQADAIVTGFVAAKYGDRTGLPVPALLTDLACDIAFYKLHRATPPESVEKRHATALSMLAKIAAGTVKIDDGQIDAQPPRPGAIHIQGTRRFSRDDLHDAL